MFDLSTIKSGEAAITMTSKEMADLTEKRHDNVKRTIDTLANQRVIAQPQIEDGEKSANGVVEKLYRIGKRDSFVIVAQLSPEFTARIVDRWQELEDQVKNSVPSIETDEGKLLMIQSLVVKQLTLINENKEIKADRDQAVAQKAEVQAELKLLAPKADALDRIAMADGMLNLQTAGKVLQQPPNKFIQKLRELHWIYKPPGCTTNRAHVGKINTGYLATKAYEITMPDGTTRVRDQVLVTPKGLAKLALLLGARPEFGLTA